MLKIIFALLLLPIPLTLFSQKYTTAAGLRLGGGIGITVQQAMWNHYTAELQWQKGFTNRRTIITALLERHHGIPHVLRGVSAAHLAVSYKAGFPTCSFLAGI